MDKQLALEKIKALIDKYQIALKDGRIPKYNEEMTKKDFILPLFEALGWKTSDSTEVSGEEKYPRCVLITASELMEYQNSSWKLNLSKRIWMIGNLLSKRLTIRGTRVAHGLF